MNEKSALFEEAPVSRAVLSLAVPTVLAQLITVVYNMADTFFIGKLNNPDLVAAATVAMPLFMFLTGIANRFGIGGSSLISRCLGQRDFEGARRTSAFCFWSGLAAALLYGILVYLARPWLLPLLGSSRDVYGPCSSFIFYTILIGSAPTVLSAELAHLVRTEGMSRQASFGIALGGILNIILDPLFMFAFHMGLRGAPCATLLSNVCACVYFFILIGRKRDESVITLFPPGSPFPGRFLSRFLLPGFRAF